MDPSQIQEDKANDTHSLEDASGTLDSTGGLDGGQATKNADGKAQITDASGGGAATPPPPVKKSIVKRLWHKLNIYLMLFFLVVILAVGIVVMLTVKSKQDAQKIISSQGGLSQSALQQLANTDVTVGDAKQIASVMKQFGAVELYDTEGKPVKSSSGGQ